MEQQSLVVGGFSSREQAERAADELRSAGFDDSRMVVAVREGGGPVAGMESNPTALSDLLASEGFSADEAQRFGRAFAADRAVVAVWPDGRRQDAIRIMRDFGAKLDDEPLGPGTGGGSGYDTSVGTRSTFDTEREVPIDQIGAVTGEERSWEQLHPRYREEFERSPAAAAGLRWEEAEPGYRYGYEMSTESTLRGRDWQTAEPDLQRGYPAWSQAHGYQQNEGIWDQIKDAVRDAWNRAVHDDAATDVQLRGTTETSPSGMGSRWYRLTPTPRAPGAVTDTSVFEADERADRDATS